MNLEDKNTVCYLALDAINESKGGSVADKLAILSYAASSAAETVGGKNTVLNEGFKAIVANSGATPSQKKIAALGLALSGELYGLSYDTTKDLNSIMFSLIECGKISSMVPGKAQESGDEDESEKSAPGENELMEVIKSLEDKEAENNNEILSILTEKQTVEDQIALYKSSNRYGSKREALKKLTWKFKISDIKLSVLNELQDTINSVLSECRSRQKAYE